MSRLVKWEWGIVFALLVGLGISLLSLSAPSDPKRLASDLVVQMKAAALGRPLGSALFGSLPSVQRNKTESVVTVSKVPPKVCVLASWELYRLGVISINGVAPNRVSAARLVELCNEGETATLSWSAKTIN